MVEKGNGLEQEGCRGIGSADAQVDIERICREKSEQESPPQVFLVSSRAVANALLAVSTEFLEDGQFFGWPGMPLFGATFDPDWGYSRAEIEYHSDGPARFLEPRGAPETFTLGGTLGYRLCPIENHEIPEVIGELARIRAEVAKPRKKAKRETEVFATDL